MVRSRLFKIEIIVFAMRGNSRLPNYMRSAREREEYIERTRERENTE